MRYRRLEHRFVEFIPEALEPGALYISMPYATAVHLCCCGCGLEVVTPFTPTDWRMIFDGETISLRPSVGNWSLPCRSHYVITNNKVVKAGRWSDQAVLAEQQRDRRAKDRFFGSGTPNQAGPEGLPTESLSVPKRSALANLFSKMFRH